MKVITMMSRTLAHTRRIERTTAMHEIQAQDLKVGDIVKFFDGQWHHVDDIVREKGYAVVVYDTRGYYNTFSEDAYVQIQL